MLSAFSSLQKSTNVRSQKTSLRFFIQSLQKVSPKLAAGVAEKLFCTPRGSKQKANEGDALLLATPLPVVIGGKRLAAWQWGDGPTVLLVHGWSGRASQLAGFVDPLVLAGFRVVAVDVTAHGASEGSQATLADFADAIYATAAAAGGVDYVICHSFGAAGLWVALSRGLSVKRIVMLAPVGPLRYGIGKFFEALGLSEEAQGLFFERIAQRTGMNVHSVDRDIIAPTMNTPLLVIHDNKDKEVPFFHSQDLVEQWKNAQLIETSSLGHNRLLRDQNVIQQATSFIAGDLQQKPHRLRLADEFEALHLW